MGNRQTKKNQLIDSPFSPIKHIPSNDYFLIDDVLRNVMMQFINFFHFDSYVLSLVCKSWKKMYDELFRNMKREYLYFWKYLCSMKEQVKRNCTPIEFYDGNYQHLFFASYFSGMIYVPYNWIQRRQKAVQLGESEKIIKKYAKIVLFTQSILFLGDRGVGKTSFVHFQIHGKNHHKCDHLSSDFYFCNTFLQSGQKMCLHIEGISILRFLSRTVIIVFFLKIFYL